MEKPTVRIRRATADDTPALYALTRKFATSFVTDPDAHAAGVAELVGTEHALFAVAVADGDHDGDHDDGGAPIGYVLAFDHRALYANGRVAFVEEITVREDLRRQGIGAALMQAVEIWAAERGCRLVGLMTRRAGAFYTALGYDESAVYYRKLLPPS